jgi:hypothetical protein
MKTIVFALVLSVALAGTFLDQQSIIEHVNSLKTTWTAGHNHYFDGRTMEEIKGLMGTLETPAHMKLPEKDITPKDLKDIPEEFFSATNWPKCESIK